MFQILEFTEARLASVTNRVEKHGDDEVPAVSLGIEITSANTLLDTIDPKLRQSLYVAVEGQEQLPGIEPATPVLRCNSIERVILPTAHEGWSLTIDDGIDDTKPMAFGSVKVDKLTVEPKQGGSIVLRLRLGTSDVDAERLGWLAVHNGQSIWITLRKPEAAAVIDGTVAAFQADHPDASAEDLFSAADDDTDPGEGDGDGDPDEFSEEEDEGAAPDLETRLDATLADADAEQPAEPERGDNWPFGTREAAGETEGATGETEPAANETKPRRGRKAA